MIFQQKLRGAFHIIFCSKPLRLQVLALLPLTAAPLTLDGVTWSGRGFEQKLYERHPLIFAEKSPFKIFYINLETPMYNGPARER